MGYTKVNVGLHIEFNQIPDGNETAAKGSIGYFNGKRYKNADGLQTWYEDVLEVESFAELKLITAFKLGDTVLVKSYYGDDEGGGGQLKLVSKAGDVNDDNGGTIFVSPGLFRWERLEYNLNDIDVVMFGAVGKVKFSNKKIPSVSANPIGTVPDCTDAFNRAIAWLDRDRSVFPATTSSHNIPTRILRYNDHYLIDPTGLDPSAGDVAITVPNGILLTGMGSFHSNYMGVNIDVLGAFGLVGYHIRVYYKLWNGFFSMEWYTKNGQTEPVDQYSVGVRYNSCRNITAFTEAMNFKSNLQLTDDGVESGGVVGTSLNKFKLGYIFGGRWGLDISTENEGWSNQNNFEGGAIKLLGYPDRSTTINTTCAGIYTRGNGDTYMGINMEGNQAYQHVINDVNGDNVFINIRKELAHFIGAFKLGRNSTWIGGSQTYPQQLATVGTWENIDGTLDQTKLGFVFELGTSTQVLADGRLHLRGSSANRAFQTVLKLESSPTKDLMMTIGNGIDSLRHIAWGADKDYKIDFHTGPNNFVDFEKLCEHFQIINEIPAHVTGNQIGIGDWILNPADSEKWFAAGYNTMGVDLATDITDNKFFLPKTSGIPVSMDEGILKVPELTGQDIDGNPISAKLSKGSHDLHNVGNAESTFTFSADVTDLDVTGYSPTIFLDNTDTGVTHNIEFDKVSATSVRGGLYLFENVGANPITFTNSKISGIFSSTGNQITLQPFEWVLAKSLRDLTVQMSFTEIARGRVDQYSSITNSDIASLPASPEIYQQFYLEELQDIVTYTGDYWAISRQRVFGTTAQRPKNAYFGFRYVDLDTQEVLVWNGISWIDNFTNTLSSQDLTTWNQTDVTVTASAETDPDGGTGAYHADYGAASNLYSPNQTLEADKYYVFSCWAKGDVGSVTFNGYILGLSPSTPIQNIPFTVDETEWTKCSFIFKNYTGTNVRISLLSPSGDLHFYDVKLSALSEEKDIPSLNTSGNQANVPLSPVIAQTYFHTDLGMEVQYDGAKWTRDGFRVIGTTSERPIGTPIGFKYYNTTTVGVEILSDIVNSYTGTSHTFTLEDAIGFNEFSNAGAINVTVPLNSSVAFPVGTVLQGSQAGVGQVTFLDTGAVVIHTTETLKARKQYSNWSLRKKATDTWELAGDLELV